MVVIARKKLTKAEARIAIAKDVIKSLNVLKVETGTYIYKNDIKLKREGSAQKDIKKIKKDCHVCALGACMLSYIQVFNNVINDELLSRSIYNSNSISLGREKITNKLKKYFSTLQLNMIESAFECQNYVNISDIATKCIDFGFEYETDKERLRAIMTNIIENNGTFKP